MRTNTATQIARCAAALALCAGCSPAGEAELGIFELRPRRDHDSGAAGSANPPPPSAQPQLALALAVSTAEICPGECIELSASASGGRAPYRYHWDLDGVGLAGPGPHRLCPATAATYFATVTDADFERSGVEVGDTVQWELEGLRGPGPHRVCPTEANTYRAFAFDADFESSGFEVGAETRVEIGPECEEPSGGPLAVAIDASASEICAGECVTLTAVASGGRAPHTYTWEQGFAGAGPHQVCPTRTTTYRAFAFDADFAQNGLEVGATKRIGVSGSCDP